MLGALCPGKVEMTKGIKKAIYRVREAAQQEIRCNAQTGGRYAGAMSGEGYAGGYLQALSDVLAALDGYPPSNSRYGYHWQTPNVV